MQSNRFLVSEGSVSSAAKLPSYSLLENSLQIKSIVVASTTDVLEDPHYRVSADVSHASNVAYLLNILEDR